MDMVARFFTMICLIVALIGTFAATMVARAELKPASWRGGEAVSCSPIQKQACLR
jgi:hypothetical protein